MTTELTDIGSSTGVNSQVVLEVVPLAEHILLGDALWMSALEENDSSLGERVFELILFIPYLSDLILCEF